MRKTWKNHIFVKAKGKGKQAKKAQDDDIVNNNDNNDDNDDADNADNADNDDNDDNDDNNNNNADDADDDNDDDELPARIVLKDLKTSTKPKDQGGRVAQSSGQVKAKGYKVPSARTTNQDVDIASRPPSVGPQSKSGKGKGIPHSIRKRQQELPLWSDDPQVSSQSHPSSRASSRVPSTHASSSIPSRAPSRAPSHASSHASSTPAPAPSQWPEDMAIIKTHGKVNLSDQHERVSLLLKAALNMSKKHWVMENAYPEFPFKIGYYRQLLCEAADVVEDEQIRSRLERDTDYVKALGSAIEGRLTILRGTMKKTLSSGFAPSYGLGTEFAFGPPTAKAVDWYLDQNHYIYPTNSDNEVDNTLLFQHPYIINGLYNTYFKGAKSFVNQNIHLFDVKHNGKTKKECSDAMIAMVATVIESLLQDYKSGTHKPTNFESNSSQDVYRSHMDMLTKTARDNPSGYHTMKARLFQSASSGQQYVDIESKTKEAYEYANVAAMPVDD
ncbi:hypothetical protein K474DRAFT_1714216 [Panus rudis PR-1116 ss-1]|nr:hypothetical protein K474DRAFT_1714216 [Panus rudis PR-1116 ss-1]